MAYNNIREEELKNKVAKDVFNAFDCTKIVGNLDFCVTLPSKSPNLHSCTEIHHLNSYFRGIIQKKKFIFALK